MKEEIKDIWVKALRSGKYKQTQLRLRNGDKFCALGVLCDLCDPTGWDTSSIKSCYRARGGMIAPSVQEWSGIRSGFAEFKQDGKPNSIMKINDSGKSFTEIADVIEEYWERL